MATWKDRLLALNACGVFEDVPDKSILLEGDPTAGTSTWQGEMAFSMPIQQYLDRGKIVGALQDEEGKMDILESSTPDAPGQVIVINGKPSFSLLHRLGELLNLPLEVVPGHYSAPDWIPLRAIPSRMAKPPSIRMAFVGLFNPALNKEDINFYIRQRPSDMGLNSQESRYHRIPIGDDIYRRIYLLDVLDRTFCVLEHHISFSTYYESQNGWSGLLLCDTGKKKGKSEGLNQLHSGIPLLPSTQPLRFQPWANYNHIKFPRFNDLDPESQRPRPFEWRLSMGETISIEQRELCQEDPFAFMADLLETSALSWTRLLSYLQTEIADLQIDFKGYFSLGREKGLDLLQSEKEILSRASKYFAEVISFLVDRKSFFTAECSKAEDRKRVDEIAARLLKDFEFLRQEADRLSRDRSEGISILMSTMSIRESRKGLEDARRVRLVTYLAFVFIPLSFVSSVFGMNVREFSNPGPGIWLFFAIAGPLTLACLCWPIWLEFSEEVKKKFMKFWLGLLLATIYRR